MQAEIQIDIVSRLNTAVSHLHTIRELVEASSPCEDVIRQLRAVKVALRVTETRLLARQIKHSEEIIIIGSVEARIPELARLHKLYVLLEQQSKYGSKENE
ncbi:MAG: hypothetical protein A2032_05080 [Chloroflexi bacterium RBG_19FT_COMBO_49_13]|nr:MAG: hypothetical protein A2Y53_04055 [Chloroflexi bacterium RBG_16_47_49]OGO62177.1 MAG: hypothetical protein A2032_05080 [Chloroflexi bacterium RBG_19FT_COMBO_49_13]